MHKAQNYDKPLARLLAKVFLNGIYDAKGAYVTEEVEPNKDDAEKKELHAELRSNFDADVIKSVARMHQQLGHPTPDRLASELADLDYDKKYSARARRYGCETCLKRQRPALYKPAKLRTIGDFNVTVDIDVFHPL